MGLEATCTPSHTVQLIIASKWVQTSKTYVVLSYVQDCAPICVDVHSMQKFIT